LAACATHDTAGPAGASFEVNGRQEATGKPPTQAEFAALVAACQDRVGSAETGWQLDGCLADLGLRRVQRTGAAGQSEVAILAVP
jgi:hypothetical protein